MQFGAEACSTLNTDAILNAAWAWGKARYFKIEHDPPSVFLRPSQTVAPTRVIWKVEYVCPRREPGERIPGGARRC
ncbi:hypothetical protein KM043_013668 [Ampulex compressa]|nr:hypothetical protein KM043_013668 [Ampulex compressa]